MFFTSREDKLKKKIAKLEKEYEWLKSEQKHYALKAYSIDMMQQPYRWGVLQARSYSYANSAVDVRDKIDQLKKETNT